MAEATVQVYFVGNTQKYRGAVDEIESSNSKLSEGFGKVAAVVGGAFAADKVIDFGRSALGSASDLNETLSKSNTIFGQNGKDIEQWASGAAKSFGQSKQQALEAAGTFGNMFTQLGIGTDQAAGMSEKMTELASDFASFHNANPADVLEAMTAAFRGEYDSVQKYVPTISAATVEQKALEMGLAGSTKELTAQHKALATQALLMEGAGAAMGDFDRTSDSLANRQRILSARWEDMQAALGQKLLPIATRFSGWMLNDAIPAIEKTSRWLNDNLVPAIEDGFKAIQSVIQAAVGWWKDHWDQISAVVETVVGVIRGVIETAFGAIEAFWRTWGGTITRYLEGLWNAIRQIIEGAINVIRGIIQTVMALIHGDFSGAWDGIRRIFAGVWEIINGIVDGAITTVRTTIEAGMRLIAGIFDAAWDAIRGAVSRFTDAFVDFFSKLPGRVIGALGDLGAFIWAAISGGFERLGQAIGNAVDFYVDFYIQMPGRILGALGDLGGTIWGAIRSGMAGLRDELKGIVDGIVSFFESMPGRIVSLAGDMMRAGAELASSLIRGLLDAITGAGGAAADFARQFGNAVIEVINGQIIDRINSLLEFTVKVPLAPDIHVNPPDIPHIPHLAMGGIVTRPTLALIGEAGPEAVIPLSRAGAMGGAQVNNYFYGTSRRDIPMIQAAVGQAVAMAGRRVAVDARGTR